jgi:hypothetical protein
VESKDQLSVLKLRLAFDSVDMFRAALFEDFGSLTDHTEMLNSKLLIGSDGLDGLLSIIEQVVDSFPIEDVRYLDFMNLFSTFGSAISKKILNFSKVCSIFYY